MRVFFLLSLFLGSKDVVFGEESSATTQTVRYRLVKMARTFLGLPYRWGGMSERRGVDCSGLVKMLFAKLHVELPRSSREQIHSGKEIPIDQLEMGDLVFFSIDGEIPNHVGIYVGQQSLPACGAESRAGDYHRFKGAVVRQAVSGCSSRVGLWKSEGET
jgi:cell wall-associated NlpC family hydrolase